MKISKRSPTTRDVALLWQLYKDGQLLLAPEFQRNSVWPTAAKAYLIDTILNDRPIPLLFLQRARSAQTGRPVYAVIDGQQRLRAIFDFFEDRFRLTESKGKRFFNKYFSQLKPSLQEKIFNYDLIVDELSGYEEGDIRDTFIRMNKYVVKLSRQELRHAKHSGAFYKFAESVGHWKFWEEHRVFSKNQVRRMRAVEFSAELAILLIEGPQDKKSSVDLYYGEYKKRFPAGKNIRRKLEKYFNWLVASLPDFNTTFVRKPVDFYSLIAALDRVSRGGKKLGFIKIQSFVASLDRLEQQLSSKEPSKEASRYLAASSRQTDNVGPRNTRIEILSKVLRGEF